MPHSAVHACTGTCMKVIIVDRLYNYSYDIFHKLEERILLKIPRLDTSATLLYLAAAYIKKSLATFKLTYLKRSL